MAAASTWALGVAASRPAPETITPDNADGTGVDDGPAELALGTGVGTGDGVGVGGGVGLGFGGGVGLGFGEGVGVAVGGGEGLCVGCVESGAAQADAPAVGAADGRSKPTARTAINHAPSRGASLDPISLLLRGTITAWTTARQSVHTEG